MKRKILILVVLFTTLSLGSIFFVACNREEQQTQEVQRKNQILGDKIPDSTYIGYYQQDVAKKIEIKERVKNNEVVKRWLNGKEQDLNLMPSIAGRFWKDGDNDYAKNKAIDLALQLADKYPLCKYCNFHIYRK